MTLALLHQLVHLFSVNIYLWVHQSLPRTAMESACTPKIQQKTVVFVNVGI